MSKKICTKHIQIALALAAKFRGMMEKLDKPGKIFTTKEKF